MRTGHLKFIVLKFLVKGPLSGYDLMKGIEEETGWKPSTGSMYPLLESLLKEGLATSQDHDRRTVYTISEKGKKFLDDGLKKKNEMLDRQIEYFKVFESYAGKGECGFMLEVLKKMKEGKIPFKEVNPELYQFKENIFKMYKTGTLESHREQVKKIIAEANEKLKKI